MIARPYQQKALDEIRGLFLKGKKKALLQLATGAGKTYIFSTMLKNAHAKGKNCVMVVRGRSLVDQASRRLEEMGVDHSVFMADDKRFDPLKLVQICSIDTCRARSLYPPADLVVIDEAHYAVSESFKEFLSHYPDAYLVSVTATPWSKDGLEHLAEDVVYPISIRELIDQRFLCPAKYFVPSTFDASKIDSQNGDFKEQSSIFQMLEQKIHGDIIKNYLEKCANGKTFLFAINVGHATMIADLFRDNGVDSCVITADTPIEARTNLIESNNLIISISTLTTGVDVPDLKNIIMARPTQSKNLYVQMLGRGTRLYSGKEFFTVYDHVGNVERHGFIEDEVKADLKPAPKSKEKNGEAPVKVCQNCLAACPLASSFCKECGEEFPVKKKLEVKGRGELKELTLESRDLMKFQKECAKLLAKAWAHGYKQGWLFYKVKDKFGDQVFFKYKKEFDKFSVLYTYWEKDGMNDTGQKKGYKVTTADIIDTSMWSPY